MLRFHYAVAFAAIALLRSTHAQNSFSCPANNGQTVTDSTGVQYIIGCGNDTTAGSTASSGAANSFNDCFTLCSDNTNTGGTCAAFTYLGGTNGVGSGNCYWKNIVPESFVSSDTSHVAAIKIADYQAPNAPPPAPSNIPTFTCPADNYTLVTDQSGVQYIISCGTDTTEGAYANYGTNIGFDDCFAGCSNATANPTTYAPGYCDGFTYSGGANGVGGGTCYYKAAVDQGFAGGPNSNLVAAIMYTQYSGAPPTATVTPAATCGATVTSTITAPTVTKTVSH